MHASGAVQQKLFPVSIQLAIRTLARADCKKLTREYGRQSPSLSACVSVRAVIFRRNAAAKVPSVPLQEFRRCGPRVLLAGAAGSTRLFETSRLLRVCARAGEPVFGERPAVAYFLRVVPALAPSLQLMKRTGFAGACEQSNHSKRQTLRGNRYHIFIQEFQ